MIRHLFDLALESLYTAIGIWFIFLGIHLVTIIARLQIGLPTRLSLEFALQSGLIILVLITILKLLTHLSSQEAEDSVTTEQPICYIPAQRKML